MWASLLCTFLAVFLTLFEGPRGRDLPAETLAQLKEPIQTLCWNERQMAFPQFKSMGQGGDQNFYKKKAVLLKPGLPLFLSITTKL